MWWLTRPGNRWFRPSLAAFIQGLQQLGWTDGQNLRIDVRCWMFAGMPAMPRLAGAAIAGGSHAAPPLDLSVNHSVDRTIWPLEPGSPCRMMRLMKPTQLSPGQLLDDGDSCDDLMNVARGTRGASVMSSSNGIREGNLK